MYNNNPYNKNNAYAQYKNTQIQTATPGQLILLLYEGGIKFCKLAKLSVDENNIMNANKYIIKCQDIVTELMASLDMSKGGDIAKNLYSVYDYMLTQLVEANLKKDKQKLDEVQKLLEELRDSWKVAIKNTGGVKGGLKGGLGRA
jgi:flagellar protein FliS